MTPSAAAIRLDGDVLSMSSDPPTAAKRPLLTVGGLLHELPQTPQGDRATPTVYSGTLDPWSATPAPAISARVATPVPKPLPRPRDRFIVLQEWEGYVEKVHSDGAFTARLVDRTGKRADEFTTVDRDEVSDSDWPLVAPGAVFYWSIGYHISVDGNRSTSSLFRFRRMPAYSSMDLLEAEEEANDLVQRLNWTDDADTI